jgi:polar amino acid transport system substrate-binding protein
MAIIEVRYDKDILLSQISRHLHLCSLLTTMHFASLSYAQITDLQVVTESSPPYQIMQDGEVAGTATQKVKDILKISGLSASFNMYPWARAYNKALVEPNTLIYSIAKTDKRADLFHWLIPLTYYQFGLVKMSGRDDIKIDNMEDIKYYRLAVQRDDISHEWLINKGLTEDTHFITCSDINCSWQLLLNKNVDLIIEVDELIPEMLQQNGRAIDSAELVKSIPELAVTGYLATNKKISPAFLAKLKLALSKQ